MVSSGNLLSDPDWKITLTVHTDAFDKRIGAIISHNNKPIALFSRRINKLQQNYTTTEKELLATVKCLKKFHTILFGYEINSFSDNTILSMLKP